MDEDGVAVEPPTPVEVTSDGMYLDGNVSAYQCQLTFTSEQAVLQLSLDLIQPLALSPIYSIS